MPRSLAKIAEIGFRRFRRSGHCASMRAILTYSVHCALLAVLRGARLQAERFGVEREPVDQRSWIVGQEMASLISAFSFSSIGRGLAFGTAIARKPVLVKPGKVSLRFGSLG